MSVRISLTQVLRIFAMLAGLLFVMAASRPKLANLANLAGIAQEAVIRVSFLFPEREPVPVNVLTGQSCLIILDQPLGRLAVSNTETAEAVVVAPNQMMINGKASGRARFTVWAKEGEKFLFFDVDVRSNLAQIDSQVRALFPNEDIRLSQANGSVVISGNVDPKVAPQIESVVQAAGFKTVNLLSQPVQSTLQVQLQLRLAEVSRNKLTELAGSPVVQPQPGQGGYFNTGQGPYSVNSVADGNIFGTIASTLNLFVMSNNVGVFLRALQQQGAIRALAEPTLTAMNGQQASFLAGGELPVPIFQTGASGGAVTILWKEYGVRVSFKPTILDEQHIRLEIEPEVSTLDYTNAIRFNGFLIPALRTRRAKTGIELRDGQSFGIAGLLDNSESRTLAKVPLLSSIPVLGNLFKSKSFQKNETELVFIVTAKITEPLNPDAIPNMKGINGLKGSSPLGEEAPSGLGAPGGSSTTSGDAAPSKGASAAPAANAAAPVAPVIGSESLQNSDRQPEAEKINGEPAGGDPKSASPAPPPVNPGETTPAQKPSPAAPAVVLPPEKRVVSKNEVQQMGWRLRTPQPSALTAQQTSPKN